MNIIVVNVLHKSSMLRKAPLPQTPCTKFHKLKPHLKRDVNEILVKRQHVKVIRQSNEICHQCHKIFKGREKLVKTKFTDIAQSEEER